MREFIRKISHKPVLDADGNLNSEVRRALWLLEVAGKDPLEELKSCKWYLEDAIGEMSKNRKRYYAWQFKNGNPFKRGTMASLEYMLEGVKTIIGKVVEAKLDKAFQ